MIRKSIHLSLAVLLSVGLAACATSGGGPERATAKSHQGSTRIVIDEQRVARVEAAARKRGIIVQWVHKPQKTVRSDG